MKKFFRRVNRGLVLGAIALVAMVTYLVVDAAMFSRHFDDIKKTIDDYALVHTEINILPKKYLTVDSKSTQAERAELVEQRFAIANKYRKPQSSLWDYARISLERTVDSRLTLNETNKFEEHGIVFKCAAAVDPSFKIRSGGPGMASIRELKVTFTAEYVGNPAIYAFGTSFSPEEQGWQYGYGYVTSVKEESVSETDMTTIKKIVITMTFYDLTAERSGDTWKISDSSGWSSGNPHIEEIGKVGE